MNTTTETPTTQETTAKQIAIEAKFSAQEEYWQKNEQDIARLRAFMARHREAIAPFEWRAYGWNDLKIIFEAHDQKPKEIAKAFGATGWTREHDSYTCGAVNWKKEVDGCFLIIKNAENIKPKLIEEVKIA
jgi:hypothetical protein